MSKFNKFFGHQNQPQLKSKANIFAAPWRFDLGTNPVFIPPLLVLQTLSVDVKTIVKIIIIDHKKNNNR